MLDNTIVVAIVLCEPRGEGSGVYSHACNLVWFLESQLCYRTKKIHMLLVSCAEQPRDKETNTGFKCLKIDLCPYILLENKLRKCTLPSVSGRYNTRQPHSFLLTSSERLTNLTLARALSLPHSHLNKLPKDMSVKTYYHFSKNIRNPVTNWEVKVILGTLLNY